MTTPVLLPKLGFSMNEGVLARWLVENGAMVKEGQPLYELESEKSVQEIEAPAGGVVKLIAASGQNYVVGDLLAEID
jgi:pyruvate/2-oxoglutarate dehydrogenase complex dihydrolipoamide acyltransferase (E2) component